MTNSLNTTNLVNQKRDRLVRRIEAALAHAVRPVRGAPARLHEAMRYCVLSKGKRFRPLLCLGATEAVGGSLHSALSVACAIELIHAYSLVHDDLPAMDNADHRRGQPSCHKRFGEATAILVGDALLTRAFELLGSNGMPNALSILRTLSKAAGTTGLIGGQVLDLSVAALTCSRVAAFNAQTRRRANAETKFLEEIARRKTAALITASVVAGALAGQASPTELSYLRRYGQNLGLAFQLVDDLNDHDGFVRSMSPEAVQRRALTCIDRATRELAPLGKRAWILTELAACLGQIDA